MYRTCNGVWAYTDPSTRNQIQIYPRTSPYAFLWPHVPHKYEEDAVISAHRHGWCHVIDAAMTCLRSPPQVGTCSGNRLQERKWLLTYSLIVISIKIITIPRQHPNPIVDSKPVLCISIHSETKVKVWFVITLVKSFDQQDGGASAISRRRLIAGERPDITEKMKGGASFVSNE
ncbi:hypothetical protein E3N88_28844 [Mikania micrantha]|uniref:Uncharacterized protein n=1 Tax=Mikania micrantha TaxID=192012 RepID=A0A5N6N0M1_9ASTR|nr:hypothetical protein E3N88_28844 [Mikania micrantha]